MVRERARGDRNWIRAVLAEQSNIVLDCPDVYPSISSSLKEVITAIGSPFAAELTGVLVKARRKQGVQARAVDGDLPKRE